MFLITTVGVRISSGEEIWSSDESFPSGLPLTEVDTPVLLWVYCQYVGPKPGPLTPKDIRWEEKEKITQKFHIVYNQET